MSKLLYLSEKHKDLGAKMGDFSGYSMPLHYESGLIQEHLHTRSHAGLFDISHMGQFAIRGQEASDLLDYMLPIYTKKLPIGNSKYTVLLNESAGIIDDVIVTRIDEYDFLLVVNASCVDKDYAHFLKALNHFKKVSITFLPNKVLFALQGPKSEEVLVSVLAQEGFRSLTFMKGMKLDIALDKNTSYPIWINRSGYTGEDGFEISLDNEYAESLFSTILAHKTVIPVGLGARNTLRLEAGLSLYGNDMDEKTHPFSARLGFAISKKRLHDNEDPISFIGKYELRHCEEDITSRVKVGIQPEGKAPLREGVCLYREKESETSPEHVIGTICSGGVSPSLQAPIAFAYVDRAFSEIDQELWAHLRGKMIKVRISTLPFIAHKYKNK